MRTNKILNFLIRLNLAYFILLVLLVSLVVTAAFHLIVPANNLDNPIAGKTESIIALFFFTVLYGPLIETLLIQFFPIKGILFFLNKKNKHKYIIAILFSALLMSSMHIFNPAYFFYMFTIGCLLAISFIIAIHRRQNAFLTIGIVHAIWNFLVFLTNSITK